MAHEIPVTQARAEFADLVNRVVYAGERVVVTRHGRPIVALVSADDLARLEEWDAAPEPTPQVLRLSGTPATPAPPPGRPDPGHGFGIAARHLPPGGG